MSLHDLQVALGTMVTKAGLTNFEHLALTEQERIWLESLVGSEGFQLTCHIQRWWRVTKLQWMARLTLAALGSSGKEFLSAYLAERQLASLFYIPEVLGFLDFVRERAAHPHIVTIARFESALLMAREGDAAETVIEFLAPAEKLLGAVLMGDPLPAVEERRYYVLVSPLLPDLWRPMEEAELNHRDTENS